MPARGMKSGGADIPASVLIEIASDPKRYKEMLAELAKRKTDAEEAETRAGVALRELEVTGKALEEAVEAGAREREIEESRIAGELSKLNAKAAGLEGVAIDLRTREDAVEAQDIRAAYQVGENRDEAARIVTAGAKLKTEQDKLLVWEADLQEREDSLADREGKFKNRIRKLNEDLD